MSNRNWKILVMWISIFWISACTPPVKTTLVVIDGKDVVPSPQIHSIDEPSEQDTDPLTENQTSDDSTIDHVDSLQSLTIFDQRPKKPKFDVSRQSDLEYLINNLITHINDLNNYADQLEQKIQEEDQ